MLQVQSVEEPFKKPGISGPTFGVLRRADAMGLFTKAIGKLDLAAFREVVQSLRKAGIARGAEPAVRYFTIESLSSDFDDGELLRFIKVLSDALEESPAPL